MKLGKVKKLIVLKTSPFLDKDNSEIFFTNVYKCNNLGLTAWNDKIAYTVIMIFRMFTFYIHDMIWLYLSLRFYINTRKQNYPGLEEIMKEIDCFSEEIPGFRCQPEFEVNVGDAVQIGRRASALFLRDIHTGNCTLRFCLRYRM